ncbi:MAG TPA: tetratricopeptide repeat protein [Gemmatimonadaceae bacterium]|jgi:predicted negative regulator of RcsB-dependent stress response|nr:tetratricopeptide repeat protein [Gemmatimonadaceae bacterium]
MAKIEAATGPAFDDRAESVVDWARANAKYIGVAAVIVALAVLSWVFYRQYQNSQAAQAETQLSRARQSYAQGNLPLAQTDLRRVVSRFEGSSAGSQAAMLLAQTYYEQGKADSGLAVLNQSEPTSADGAAFEALKGAGYELKKEYAQAAQHYRGAADRTDVKEAKGRYLADAARALTAAGNKAEAAKIWEGLAEDESAPISAEARVRLGELTATPASR